MPSNTKRVYNFSPGPATLPTSVLEEVQKDFLNYQASGMSVIEMSHRSKVFLKIYEDAIASLRSLMSIPDRFDILFMTGGASTQFALAPLNLSAPGRQVSYINTGSWSKKAIEQAKLQGLSVNILASSEDKNFSYIPKDFNLAEDQDYLHITSNNTIFGTQYKKWPSPVLESEAKTKCPLVIDMSSDFLSRPILDWDNIALLYAGVQKNAGPAGLTIAIIAREYYDREKENTPSLFRYSTYAKNQSMYNTPPSFQIYMFLLVLKWIAEQGGLIKMAQHNEKKSELIYEVLDKYHDFYKAHANKEDRSLMNITWNLSDTSYESLFLEMTEKQDLYSLRGHRSVGGFRASVYNAMPLRACEILASCMEDFYKKYS